VSVAIPSVIATPTPTALPARAPGRQPEATLRALVAGAAIGVLLAAGNVYTSIKVSVIDGGGVTAALLGFGIFALLRRALRTPYGPLETNITQTTASSAAVMSFVTGVVGPVPALELMGTHASKVGIALFGAGIGLLGIFVAALVRRRLIVDEALPFPTGRTIAEVIDTMFTAREAAMRRIVLLVSTAALAAAVAWFRDARPTLIPQGLMFGGTVAGVSLAALGFGFSCSGLMAATGIMIGLRASLGMLGGAVIARIGLIPWLAREGVVSGTDLAATNQWLVWPALGVLLAGSFLPLLLEGGTIVRAFRLLASVARRRPGGAAPADDALAPHLWAPLLAASVVGLLVVGWFAFGMSPLVTLAALALALVLANVTARATGETDFSPAGPVATTSLILFSRRGAVSGMMGGSASMGISAQTSQTLWAFRAGHQLGASPRAQIGAQILGVLVGAVVTVPVYAVIVSSYGLGTEAMPAITAVTWRATAEAMRGLADLPRWGAGAAAIGTGAGVLVTLLGRLRIGRLLPSAATIGVGFLMPPSLTLTAVAGAVLAAAAGRLSRRVDQSGLLAVASGGIAGESIIGVIIAILMATGAL
jgi:uncharacterized oligopeptide transporter (OPT) family protein